ncbi:hypothetical protein J3R30DRAFT_305195 [Lentinula aciculospora]|uniref:F-box domain-containing protein n=1 Tax=Lentinula aciculospora TaxID=153920 RepID=A0A9W9A837_9AGAR|nr:hypothetical protein J3R30DRAFT_305195 [Lentinula aciculospora]
MSGKSPWDPLRLQSPYTSSLNSNYSASPEERLDLDALLSEPQQELSRLDSEISRTRTLLDDLLFRRHQVKNFMNAHRALMAPIRRLPAETLAEIFVHCLPTERFPTRSLEEAPLLLTRVCRGWRDIAISFPPLWNSLHVHIPSRLALDNEDLALRQRRVCEWIARSGALPLSLSLSIADIKAIHSDLQPLSQFLRTLMSFSPRFDGLVLNLGAEVYPLLEAVSPRTFPTLENLSISTPEHCSTDVLTMIPLVSFIPNMPRLQNLGINGFTLEQHLFSVCDWSNITELVLESTYGPLNLPFGQILIILSQTTKLQACRISIRAGSLPHIPLPVNLDSLHFLWIRFKESTTPPWEEVAVTIAESFRSMNCPSLKKLAVSWNKTQFASDPNYHLAFTSLLGSLHTLRLDFPVTCEALIQCLELAKNLTVLELVALEYAVRASPSPGHFRNYYTVQNPLFERLTSSHSSSELCPRLETFRLVVTEVDKFKYENVVRISTQTLVYLLQSRRADGHVLKLKVCDILIPPDPPISCTIMQTIRNLQHDGMHLRFLQLRLKPKGYYDSWYASDAPEEGIAYHSSKFPPFVIMLWTLAVTFRFLSTSKRRLSIICFDLSVILCLYYLYYSNCIRSMDPTLKISIDRGHLLQNVTLDLFVTSLYVTDISFSFLRFRFL